MHTCIYIYRLVFNFFYFDVNLMPTVLIIDDNPSIGIALDVIYSRLLGFLDPVSTERILRLLEQLGFELFANELLHENSSGDFVVLKGLEEFREHLGGQLTITLLQGVGRGFEVHEMDAAMVLAAIRELHERHQQLGHRIAAEA